VGSPDPTAAARPSGPDLSATTPGRAPGRAPGLGELIGRYFEACSSGSADDIAACFGADAVIYDLNLPPVQGAPACGEFWVKVRERWGGARWKIDHVVAAGDDAACEWTMSGQADGRAVRFRGSDHYRFDGALIVEIRQYWRFDDDRLVGGLNGYPYAGLQPTGIPGRRRRTDPGDGPRR
jgi:hypothetical protein